MPGMNHPQSEGGHFQMSQFRELVLQAVYDALSPCPPRFHDLGYERANVNLDWHLVVLPTPG